MLKIETERLILTNYKPEDFERVHIYCTNTAILIYEAWGPNTEAQTKAFLAKAITDSKVQPRLNYELAIRLKSSGQLIGGCGFRTHPGNTKRGDFGYIINPTYWNKGYATEAAMGLINYMVSNNKITEIEATCDSENEASKRVIQKCDLQYLRVLKADYEMKGKLRNKLLFERIIVEETK